MKVLACVLVRTRAHIVMIGTQVLLAFRDNIEQLTLSFLHNKAIRDVREAGLRGRVMGLINVFLLINKAFFYTLSKGRLTLVRYLLDQGSLLGKRRPRFFELSCGTDRAFKSIVLYHLLLLHIVKLSW